MLGHHAHKKSFSASERSESARQTYLEAISHEDTKALVFIGETSAYVGTSRECGWASSHERVYDKACKGKKAWVSLIAAISPNTAMAEQALVVTDTVNKTPF